MLGIPAGLKTRFPGLKSGAGTNGVKSPILSQPFAARLKSGPYTKQRSFNTLYSRFYGQEVMTRKKGRPSAASRAGCVLVRIRAGRTGCGKSRCCENVRGEEMWGTRGPFGAMKKAQGLKPQPFLDRLRPD